MTDDASTAATLEKRLAAIERTLGIVPSQRPTPEEVAGGVDVSTRIDALLESTRAKLRRDRHGAALDDDRRACEELERRLDPGSSLTHQASSSSLSCRRREVLASAAALRSTFEDLRRVRDALLDGRPTTARAETYARDAPIVANDSYERVADAGTRRRIRAVAADLADLRSRADAARARVDRLASIYERVVDAASEKTVLADEELSAMLESRARATPQ